MRKLLAISILAVAVVVSGCGSKDDGTDGSHHVKLGGGDGSKVGSESDSKVVGTWHGSVKAQGNSPQEQQVVAAYKNSVLELKKDHTYTLTVGQQDGSWSLSSATLSLKLGKSKGKTVDEMKAEAAKGPNGEVIAKMLDTPFILKVATDGKTLASDNSQLPKTAPQLIFTK